MRNRLLVPIAAALALTGGSLSAQAPQRPHPVGAGAAAGYVVGAVRYVVRR